jgi:hypothetical protein
MRRLAVLALISGCYTAPAAPAESPAPVAQVSGHARTAADPLGFLPIDADVVVSLDTGALRQTALWSRLEPSFMERAASTIERFRTACGFDPVPQIEHVALGIRHLDTPHKEAVIVVGGIQRSQLMSCVSRAMRSATLSARVERNVVVLAKETDGQPVAFAFADARTFVMLVGDRAAGAQGLRDILDAGAPLRGNEMFMDLFGRVDVRRHAWFYVDGRSKLLEGIGAMGVHPRAIFGGVDMPAGATAKVFVRMPTASEATTLVTMVQGQLAAVRSLVEKLDVTAEDVDVVVDLALTEDQLMVGANLLGP